MAGRYAMPAHTDSDRLPHVQIVPRNPEVFMGTIARPAPTPGHDVTLPGEDRVAQARSVYAALVADRRRRGIPASGLEV